MQVLQLHESLGGNYTGQISKSLSIKQTNKRNAKEQRMSLIDGVQFEIEYN